MYKATLEIFKNKFRFARISIKQDLFCFHCHRLVQDKKDFKQPRTTGIRI